MLKGARFYKTGIYDFKLFLNFVYKNSDRWGYQPVKKNKLFACAKPRVASNG